MTRLRAVLLLFAVAGAGAGAPPLAPAPSAAATRAEAHFTFTPPVPSTDQTILLDGASSTGTGDLDYEWDLDGDGDFDEGVTGQTTSVSFPTPGPHVVRLQVKDQNGDDKVARTIQVNDRPEADFTVSPDAPLTGDDVTFTSDSNDSDGTIVSYEWEIDGDGFNEGSDPSLTTSFGLPGDHEVRLRVTDNDGGQAIATKTVTIANRPPIASFSVEPGIPRPNEPATLTSTSTDPDDGIAGQAWDIDGDGFDDGTGSTLGTVFQTSGPQEVRLAVTDPSGAVDIVSQMVNVNLPPLATFNVGPDPAVAGAAVTLTSTAADADGTVTAVSWDLNGDGLFGDAAGPSASTVFGRPGLYTVGMLVTDDDGETAARIATVNVVAGTLGTVTPKAPVTRLNPFPKIRVAGRLTRRGVRLRLLTVAAPAESTIRVTCRGRSCPFSRRVLLPDDLARASGTLRIGTLERSLRAGVLIVLRVIQPGKIGKYTSVRIRRGKAPKRIDRCALTATSEPIVCPK